MTQQCPKCGEEIPKPVNVCSNCGKKLQDERTERRNPTRVEGCLSTFILVVVNVSVLSGFLLSFL